jgi:hypothetical protein
VERGDPSSQVGSENLSYYQMIYIHTARLCAYQIILEANSIMEKHPRNAKLRFWMLIMINMIVSSSCKKKMTYDLRLSIASSMVFGTSLSTVLSTASLESVCCTNLYLRHVAQARHGCIRLGLPDIMVSIFKITTHKFSKATLTVGLVSSQSGTVAPC